MPLVLRKFRNNDSGWGRVIPARLLTPLIRTSGQLASGARSPTVPLMLAIALLSIALAGPSWREAPAPLQQQNDSLVIVLDLSLSMLATDVEPDRLTLAKRKIRDILQAREGSLTALVVYSADAHVVTPLTDDSQTIVGMLDVLDPTIMPATGNRADIGIRRALDLLEQGAPGKGRLLLISDGIARRYQNNLQNALADSRYPLNTLVVGTTGGGPIPLARQGFIRDQGEIVIARSDPSSMQAAADAGGGESREMTITDEDIRALELRSEDSDDWQDSERDLTVDRWQDDGYWLLWLVIPLALLGWRRGAVLLVLFTLLPVTPRPAQAQSWDSLWLREDQRAPELIRQNPEQAAQQLEDPDLRGSALYRQGEFDSAAEAFARGNEPSAAYNQANALARAGKLEEALETYEQLLERQPDHEDARFNRDLVKQLLEQQQQQESGQQGDNSNESSENGDQQDSEQQGSDTQNGEQNQSGENQSQSEPSENQQQNGQNGEPSKQDEQAEPGQEQQAQGDQGEDNDQQQTAEAPAELETSPLSQGQEQWLRRVPDDPGGLLRRKFLQQYQQRDTQTDEGDTPW
ncbi:VWA domain-containing protein [Marinobacter confluentis]|uniref:VWA domain-containing protein n=2 Tax=Marinobacter confluentis TaxID=1697557 RepID=A0A4Z1C8E3_9GAMM|nr:VWA domain-containing protein [Marinobacter confluentis]